MSSDRRRFVKGAATALLGGFAMGEGRALAEIPTDPGASAPPANTAGSVGGASSAVAEITATTFAEAEKLMQVAMTQTQRVQAAQTWKANMGSLLERRTGPRKVALGADVVPYSQSNPLPLLHGAAARGEQFITAERDAGPLPKKDSDIAFAPVWKLARWVQS